MSWIDYGFFPLLWSVTATSASLCITEGVRVSKGQKKLPNSLLLTFSIASVVLLCLMIVIIVRGLKRDHGEGVPYFTPLHIMFIGVIVTSLACDITCIVYVAEQEKKPDPRLLVGLGSANLTVLSLVIPIYFATLLQRPRYS